MRLRKFDSGDLTNAGKWKKGMSYSELRAAGLSTRKAATFLQIDESNARRWSKTDFENDAVKRRYSNKGRPTMLNSYQEQEVLRLASERRKEYGAVTLSHVAAFATLVATTTSPSHQWASDFMRRHGWRSISSVRRDPSEVRDTLVDEVKEFVIKVNKTRMDFALDPGQLWTFDETALISGGAARSTFVPRGLVVAL